MIVSTLGICRDMENGQNQFRTTGGILFKDSTNSNQLYTETPVTSCQIRRGINEIPEMDEMANA